MTPDTAPTGSPGSDHTDTPVSPECRDRFKHPACAGQALDVASDEIVPCGCDCHAEPADTALHVPTCSSCQRQRTLADPEHPMDAYDYTPMQVVTGQPLGWYSGDDGEVCPECMTTMLRGQR